MRSKVKFLLPLLLLAALCNCGVSQPEKNTTQVQEDKHKAGEERKADESAEPVVFKNSETTVKEKRFENDYIRVWQYYKQETVFMQENLDGSERKESNLETNEFVWLTNEWLYYLNEQYEDGAGGTNYLCRSPIADGKEIISEPEKQEVLWEVSVDEFDYLATLERYKNFIVTDSYIFYGSIDKKEAAVVFYRYDLEKKENKKLFDFRVGEVVGISILQDADTCLPVTLGNSFFMENSGDLYKISYDTLEQEKIFSGDMYDYKMVKYGDSVYFCGNSYTESGCKQIFRYKAESGEAECVFTKDDFQTMLEEIHLWDNGAKALAGFFNGIYSFNDKLYMNVEVIWKSEPVEITEGKHEGEDVSVQHSRQAVLSADFSDLTQWELEQSLADYILDNAAQNIYYVWDEDSDDGNYKASNYKDSDDIYKTDTDVTKDAITYIGEMIEGKVYVVIAPKKNFDCKKLYAKYYSWVDSFRILYKDEVSLLYDISTGETEEIPEDDYRLGWLQM